MQRLKLIWDFFGPRAQGIAEHHATHIDQFMRREGLTAATGAERLGRDHWGAWLVVGEKDALRLRDVLRPNRAVQAQPEPLAPV
jgi:hypothetical protein